MTEITGSRKTTKATDPVTLLEFRLRHGGPLAVLGGLIRWALRLPAAQNGGG